jgi:hypothetical protein
VKSSTTTGTRAAFVAGGAEVCAAGRVAAPLLVDARHAQTDRPAAAITAAPSKMLPIRIMFHLFRICQETNKLYIRLLVLFLAPWLSGNFLCRMTLFTAQIRLLKQRAKKAGQIIFFGP